MANNPAFKAGLGCRVALALCAVVAFAVQALRPLAAENLPVVSTDRLHFEGLTSLDTFVLSLPVQTEIPLEDDAIAVVSPMASPSELHLAQTKVKGRSLALPGLVL